MMNIATHIQWRKFSWKRGAKICEFPKYLFWFCILQLFAFKHAQTANFFTRLFTFYNMTIAVWNGSHSDTKIYMLIRMRNQRFCCCNCHVLMQVLSILMRNIPTFWSRSLYRFSNDTRATKLVNNRFLQVYTGSVLMIFKQYTLNGKRRVSNGKCHVIKRKQTREKVCGLCQPRTQALHCFYRDQWQLINTKRARVLGQHATGNCSAWQKMHQTWRTSYSKHVRRKFRLVKLSDQERFCAHINECFAKWGFF